MFELTLFGGVGLQRDGVPIAGKAVQRRRLALLAYLALSKSKRVGRERIVALLWPESLSSGRQSLSEALYVLRSSIGDEAIAGVGDELSLSEDHIRCDVVEFERLLRDGRLEDALALYRGPFLDGFYVTAAPEFERWSESERSRLERIVDDAIGRVAQRHEDERSPVAAARWWQRAHDRDPLSGRLTLRLMRALDAAGDRAQALRVADRHARALKEEFGALPEQAVLDLAASLRARASVVPLQQAVAPADESPEKSPLPRDTQSIEGSSAVVRESVGTSAPSTISPAEHSAVRQRRRWLLPAVGTLIAVGSIAAFGLNRSHDASTDRGALHTVSVFLYPFVGESRISDATPAESLRELLSSGIRAMPNMWTIDAPTASRASGWKSDSLGALLSRARDAGAAYVVAPELLGDSAAPVVASLYDARTRQLVLRASGGERDEPLAGAVQRMALELVRGISLREGLPVGESEYLLAATRSPAALSRFLMGRDLFRRSQFDAAAASFRGAIALDSSFLLAYHRLSVVETWNPRWDYAEALRVVDLGLAHSETAPPIYARLLNAQRRYLRREARQAVKEFEWLTSDDPNLLDGWLGLGESLFHFGGFIGGDRSDARPAFERVVRIDSSFSPVYEHLADIAIRMRDRRWANEYSKRVANPKDRDGYVLATALRLGTQTEREASLGALDSAQRQTIANVALLVLDSPDTLALLGRTLLRPERSAEDRHWGAIYALVASARARPDSVAAHLRSVGAQSRFDRWIVAAHFAGLPTSGIEMAMLDSAWRGVFSKAASYDTPLSPDRDLLRAAFLDAYASRDGARIGRLVPLIERLTRQADPSDPEPAGMLASLRASSALARRDTTAAIHALEEALSRVPWWISFWAPLADVSAQRRDLSVLYGRVGRREDSVNVARSFGRTGSVGEWMWR